MNTPEGPTAYQAGMTAAQVKTLIDDVKEIKGTVQRMDDRLRTLEQARGYLLGVAAAVGAIASFLGMWLKEMWRGGR